MTTERAYELLAVRREQVAEKGGSTAKGGSKGGAKKKPAKKTAAKRKAPSRPT